MFKRGPIQDKKTLQGVLMKKIFMLLVTILCFAACEEKIENGTVPEAHRETVIQYLGTFHGEFEGRPMALNFQMNNSGLITLSVKDGAGSTELVSGCASTIGKLIAVTAEGNALQSARFQFNAQACHLFGNDLTINVKDQDHIELLVAETSREVSGPDHCVGRGYNRECFPGSSREVPATWLNGSFSRH
jgi:hypothetical protein